jgi:hypothetical protein
VKGPTGRALGSRAKKCELVFVGDVMMHP